MIEGTKAFSTASSIPAPRLGYASFITFVRVGPICRQNIQPYDSVRVVSKSVILG